MDQQIYDTLKVAQTEEERNTLIEKILTESDDLFNITKHHLPLLKLQLTAAIRTLDVIKQELLSQEDQADHEFLQLFYLLSILPQALKKVEYIEQRLTSTS